MKFEEIKLSKNVKRALEDIGYVEMTEIQEKAIPQIIEGGDFIGQSQTGTGKTASFGLPIVEKIDSEDKSVQAIILCPTRELALQVAGEIRKYVKYTESIKTLAVYGGEGIEKQIRELKRGAQIIIGTPGRVMDHMRRKVLKLQDVKMVVLDEADEMLNMGFEEDIETILKEVPEERQTVLFSATMNPRIMNITKKYLKDPVKVKIKAEQLTVENIKQVYIETKQKMKDESVTRLLDVHKPKKTIVFCNTKKKVDLLIDVLKSRGYKTEAIHGDIKQEQRNRIMKKFKSGDFNILIATDVVARGIDVEDLDLVINYDIPQEEEYYVHRIGRTGRNGNAGKAYTFVVGKEKSKMRSIEKYARTKIEEGQIPTISEIKEIKNKETLDNIQKIIDENNFKNMNLFDKLIENNKDMEQIARALFSMVTSNKVQEKEKEEKIQDIEVNENGEVKLFFNLGKKDNIMVKDIVGSITANTAISGNQIGRVNILDKFSFVEIPAEFVEELMDGMKGKQIKKRNVNIEIANN